MRPLVQKRYFSRDIFSVLEKEVPWENRSSPRDECFMALESAPQVYSYGNSNEHRKALHTYKAVPMHEEIRVIAQNLNKDFGCTYNVCVLNYYKDQHQHLGWHADDSPEQDLDHPIAVIAFGASRYFWWKPRTQKGEIPEDQKILMEPGDLVIMPGGFQAGHLHRIPKHSESCGGRISLTFRKLVR